MALVGVGIANIHMTRITDLTKTCLLKLNLSLASVTVARCQVPRDLIPFMIAVPSDLHSLTLNQKSVNHVVAALLVEFSMLDLFFLRFLLFFLLLTINMNLLLETIISNLLFRLLRYLFDFLLVLDLRLLLDIASGSNYLDSHPLLIDIFVQVGKNIRVESCDQPRVEMAVHAAVFNVIKLTLHHLNLVAESLFHLV